MKRRSFLGVLGGGAFWPLGAFGQQTGRNLKVAYLGVSSFALEAHYVEAFRIELRELGYVEGQNVVIEYRWADG